MGGNFERKIANVIELHFPGCEAFRTQQADRAYNSDITVEGGNWAFESIWWECNDEEHPNPTKKLLQAAHDAKLATERTGRERLPIVVWHKKRERRVNVTLHLATLVALNGLYNGPIGPFLKEDVQSLKIPVRLNLEDFIVMLKERMAREQQRDDAINENVNGKLVRLQERREESEED